MTPGIFSQKYLGNLGFHGRFFGMNHCIYTYRKNAFLILLLIGSAAQYFHFQVMHVLLATTTLLTQSILSRTLSLPSLQLKVILSHRQIMFKELLFSRTRRPSKTTKNRKGTSLSTSEMTKIMNQIMTNCGP